MTRRLASHLTRDTPITVVRNGQTVTVTLPAGTTLHQLATFADTFANGLSDPDPPDGPGHS